MSEAPAHKQDPHGYKRRAVDWLGAHHPEYLTFRGRFAHDILVKAIARMNLNEGVSPGSNTDAFAKEFVSDFGAAELQLMKDFLNAGGYEAILAVRGPTPVGKSQMNDCPKVTADDEEIAQIVRSHGFDVEAGSW